jgi:hypothetical protein
VTRSPSLLSKYKALATARKQLAIREGISRHYREQIVALETEIKLLEREKQEKRSARNGEAFVDSLMVIGQSVVTGGREGNGG